MLLLRLLELHEARMCHQRFGRATAIADRQAERSAKWRKSDTDQYRL